MPFHADQCCWSIGFYPLEHRGRSLGGTGETLEAARAAFEAAWKTYFPLCTDADFAEHRRQRAYTSWKYRMHDVGMALPTQMASGQSRCFCGTVIDIASVDRHIEEAHLTAIGRWRRHVKQGGNG